MGSSGFKQFVRMYLESLTEAELKKAIEEVEARLKVPVHSLSSSTPPGSDPRGSIKQLLEKLWRDHRFGQHVSRYFQQLHQPAIAFFDNKDLDAIREALPEATKQFGARAVAFALFVHPDNYRQEIGREFLAGLEEGMLVEKPDPESSKTQETDAAVTVEPGLVDTTEAADYASDVVPAIVQETIAQFRMITSILDQDEIPGSNDSWLPRFGDELQALNKAWNKYREGRSARAKRISAILQEITELNPMLQDIARYCGFSVSDVLLDSACLLHRTFDELTQIETVVKGLRSYCDEIASLRTPAGSLTEEQQRISRLIQLAKNIRTSLDELRSLNGPLGPDKPPQGHGGPGQPTCEPQTECMPTAPPPPVPPPNTDQPAGITAVTPITVEPHSVPKRKELEEGSDIRVLYLLRALADNDVATAYWLAREAEEIGDKTPREILPPSWFLFALFGGTTSACLRSNEAKELLQNIFIEAHSRPLDELGSSFGSRRAAALLVAMAALRPALFAPETGAHAWLQNALGEVEGSEANGLDELLRSVLGYSGTGEPLDILDLQDANSPARRSMHMLRCQKDLERWLAEAASARVPFPRAATLLHDFAKGNPPEFGDAVDVIRRQQVENVKIVKDLLNAELSNHRTIAELVDERWESCRGRKHPNQPELEGKTRAQIINKLMDLRMIMQSWVQMASPGPASPDWRRRQVHQLVDDMLAAWRRLQPALMDSQGNMSGGKQSEITQCDPDSRERIAFRLAVQQLTHLFDEILNADASAISSTNDGGDHEADWQELLLRPLLALSPLPVDLGEDGSYDLRSPLRSEGKFVGTLANGRTWKDALQAHVQAHDFLAARLVVAVMEREMRDADQRAELNLEHAKEEIARKQNEALDVTLRRVEQLRADLEKATLAHALTASDHAQLDGELNSLVDRIEKLGRNPQRIGVLESELGTIQAAMNRMQEERTRSLHEHIESMQRELTGDGESNTSTTLGQAQRSQAISYVRRAEESFHNHDYALADGFLEFAELVLTTGADDLGLPELSETVPPQTSSVEDVYRTLNDALESAANHRHPRSVQEDILRQLDLHPRLRNPVGGLNLENVPGARKNEIRAGLDAYYDIKQARPDNPGEVSEALPKVMAYLGFLNPSVKLLKKDVASMHFEALMSGESLSPLPEFGSERAGRYDIVVLYGRPSASTIGQILTAYQVETRCPIVLFAGRMTWAQREEWSRYCWEKQLTALMVDELLLYYVACQRDSRIPAVVSLGVAWGYANPYRHSGPIPPELFKGREAMVRQLGEPRGSCVVYGGRQLGKSVLLRTVQRVYHDPRKRTFVWCYDIKNIGGAEEYGVAVLWKALVDWLVESGILPKNARQITDQYQLEQQILKRFEEDPSLRILLLLDEADNFLDYDSAQGFQNVHWFKQLMDQTGRRFKVVFCGLHSVQRFYDWKNHLFTDQPIVVTPLKAGEARKLVIEPMSALGFRFDAGNENAVLRILCYTNYHPALIQQFCHELVDVVRGRQHVPPYKITMDDVEQVYSRGEVRKVMRERFEWTIGLDVRYQAIVYSMIHEQFNDLDGFRREFSAKDVSQYVRSWWPAGFNSVSEQQVKALLEELIGLGVLIKREDGKYRLRNGNVVRALGSEKEIEDRLLQIAETLPPDQTDQTAARRLLSPSNGTNPERAPLTVRQTEDILQRHSGVALVFGTDALGLSKIELTLKEALSKYFEGNSDQGHQCMNLPEKHATTPTDIAGYLVRQAKGSRPGYYVYHSWAGSLLDKTHMGSSIAQVAQALAQLARRPQVMRWVALFDAEQIWRWYQISREERDIATTQAVSVVTLTRWNDHTISQALDDIEALNSAYACRRVMEVTGGWPWLWKELRNRILGSGQSRTRSDIDSIGAADQLQKELESGSGALVTQFRKALGIDRIPDGRHVLRLVNDLGAIPWSLLAGMAADDEALKTVPREQVIRIAEALVWMGILDETPDGLVVEPVAAKVILA